MPILVLTGPSGVGKTAVGSRVAAHSGALFLDADDLHTAAARAQMARGEPLEDADREPWLARVATRIEAREHSGEALVVACSALRLVHRDKLRAAAGSALVIGLRAPEAVLRTRIAARQGHYFGVELVASQLAALEDGPLEEALVMIDAQRSLEDVVETVLDLWKLQVRGVRPPTTEHGCDETNDRER